MDVEARSVRQRIPSTRLSSLIFQGFALQCDQVGPHIPYSESLAVGALLESV